MASEYHRGDMDISEQVATFNLFNGMTKWGSLAIASMMVLLVLWFCTPAGFLAGFISGMGLLVLGIVFLREKPAADH
ncbi:aa3-type cytochrome c oxidase subunit IV [Phenylobacterium sp.]|uniref:aa3-type cytochrome c oxidase subunit IV n=1 Tax=Phenylobacterium sp. TaxID=1871053 RepID=UPI0030F384B5